MRGPRSCIPRWCVCLVLTSTAVWAQERGFSVHRGDGALIGAATFLVDRPWYSDERRFAIGLTADYAHRSLVPSLPEQVPPILEHALLGRLELAGSFFDRVTVFGSAPISLLERGTAERVSQAAPSSAVAFGDPRVGVLVRLVGHSDRDVFSLHLGAELWVPIGVAAGHQGDVGLRVMPRAVVAGAVGWVRYSLEGAYLHRPYASLGPPALGLVGAPELRAGAALGLSLLDDRLSIGPEARFATQVQGEKAFTAQGSSLELLGGARLLIADQLSLGVAAGTGLFAMAGTPDLRGFVRIAWTPVTPHESDVLFDADAGVGAPNDLDTDEVSNVLDRCPYEPETVNGVRDRDGCPEFVMGRDGALARLLVEPSATARATLVDAGPPTTPSPRVPPSLQPELADGGMFQLEVVRDSDGDGQPDDVDRCPITKEDPDGFEDDDGCPEADNDADGLVDADDQCALEAETFNGVDDQDGCPDLAPDADHDTVADAIDRCPYEPESLDGARDEDGCPEFVTPGRGPTFASLLSSLDSLAKGAKPADLDRDLVPDAEDRCPLLAEDRDGFEDDDGCPETDDDDDGIADARDRCPDSAETFDSYQDDDGCPDEKPDADGDGLDFAADRCPLEPGDAIDGCPHLAPPALALADVTLGALPRKEPASKPFAAADFDKDGIVDDDDRCPLSKEDKDEFEDDDGCPETDNDHDGVDDAKDKCPFEAETINGTTDDDGCPDPGIGAVTVTKDAVLIAGTIQFKTASAALQPSATPLLKQVAATLKANASISIEIQGHTDDVGNAAKNIVLSKKRAETIRAFLVKAGVSVKRLVANGYGPTRPRATNATAAGREQNRRVEFKILGEAK